MEKRLALEEYFTQTELMGAKNAAGYPDKQIPHPEVPVWQEKPKTRKLSGRNPRR